MTGLNDADNVLLIGLLLAVFGDSLFFGGSDLHSPRRFSVRDSEEPALWLDTFYGWSVRLSLSDW